MMAETLSVLAGKTRCAETDTSSVRREAQRGGGEKKGNVDN